MDESAISEPSHLLNINLQKQIVRLTCATAEVAADGVDSAEEPSAFCLRLLLFLPAGTLKIPKAVRLFIIRQMRIWIQPWTDKTSFWEKKKLPDLRVLVKFCACTWGGFWVTKQWRGLSKQREEKNQWWKIISSSSMLIPTRRALLCFSSAGDTDDGSLMTF